MKDKQVLLVKAAKRMRDRKMKGGTLQIKQETNQNKASQNRRLQTLQLIVVVVFFACESIKVAVWLPRSFISPTFVPLPPESVSEPCRLRLVCLKCRPTARPLHWSCASLA